MHQVQSLYQSILNPRRKQSIRYTLAAVLTVVVVAILANHTSVLAIAEWIADQSAAIQRACGFAPGQTRTTPMQRLLQRLSPVPVASV